MRGLKQASMGIFIPSLLTDLLAKRFPGVLVIYAAEPDAFVDQR